MSVIRHPEPMIVLSPIAIVVVALIVEPDIPTLFPITIRLPDAEILKKQGWNIPTELEVNLLLQWKLLPIVIVPFLISGCNFRSNQELRFTYKRPLIPQDLLNGKPASRHQKKVGRVENKKLYKCFIAIIFLPI